MSISNSNNVGPTNPAHVNQTNSMRRSNGINPTGSPSSTMVTTQTSSNQPLTHTHIPVGSTSPSGTQVTRRQIITTTRDPSGMISEEFRSEYPPTSTNPSSARNTTLDTFATAAAAAAAYDDAFFIVESESGEMSFDLREMVGQRLSDGSIITGICRRCRGMIVEGMVHRCGPA